MAYKTLGFPLREAVCCAAFGDEWSKDELATQYRLPRGQSDGRGCDPGGRGYIRRGASTRDDL